MPRRHLAFLVLALFLGAAPACKEETEPSPPVEGVPPLEPATGPWNGQAVAFTFTSDDGDLAANRAWTAAFLENDARYTLFIITGQVGLPTRLTAADLQEFYGQGFEIGSHSRSHVRLTDLSDDRLWDELAGSRSDLLAMLPEGYECRSVSYPSHAHDARVMAAAESAGYQAARDGGTGAAGHPDFSEGASSWGSTSLYEVPITVTASWLTNENKYTEIETRSQVRTLVAAARVNQLWINVFAHFLSDIDGNHMRWIVDEFRDSGAWIGTFDEVAAYWSANAGG